MGWWNTIWDELEPATQEHIVQQREVQASSESLKRWACGCERSTPPGDEGVFWHLCEWHEGFDEGASIAGHRTEHGERDGN